MKEVKYRVFNLSAYPCTHPGDRSTLNHLTPKTMQSFELKKWWKPFAFLENSVVDVLETLFLPNDSQKKCFVMLIEMHFSEKLDGRYGLEPGMNH